MDPLERRRVHRHQDVRRVSRREHVVVGEVHLERRDAGDGARRRADLRREVRQRGQVVAEDGAGVGEPITRDLHAIAGVTGEADHDVLDQLRPY